MDVYVPEAAGPAAEGGGLSGAPVALFCHGGIWAHGERWHYAPMASRLAQVRCRQSAVLGYS